MRREKSRRYNDFERWPQAFNKLKAIPLYEQKKIWKEHLLMKERIIERTINGIKVTSHIPEDVSESFKQNKINQIYDILVAADKRIDKADKPESEKTA